MLERTLDDTALPSQPGKGDKSATTFSEFQRCDLKSTFLSFLLKMDMFHSDLQGLTPAFNRNPWETGSVTGPSAKQLCFWPTFLQRWLHMDEKESLNTLLPLEEGGLWDAGSERVSVLHLSTSGWWWALMLCFHYPLWASFVMNGRSGPSFLMLTQTEQPLWTCQMTGELWHKQSHDPSVMAALSITWWIMQLGAQFKSPYLLWANFPKIM